MARVVTQRSSTPYLYVLVVFVFLFVIAGALAVLGFMSGSEAKEESALKSDQIRELKQETQQQQQTIEDLVQLITGQPGSAEVAVKVANDAYQQINEQGKLAPELVNATTQIARLNEEIQQRQRQIEELEKKLQAQEEAIEDLKAAHAKAIEKLTAEKKELVSQLEAESAKREEALAQAEKEFKNKIASMQDRVKEMERQIERLILERQDRDKRIRKLNQELGKVKRGKDVETVNEADGQIEKVAQNADICYINIGSKDRVKPGLTFAVYQQGSAGKGEPKGRIEVLNVSENFSECKILSEDEQTPIVVGDVVANLAFDPTREYTFVVKGLFDLHGTGQPSKYGREEIRDAIQKFGGQVKDEIDIQTDFLVLGSEPQRPASPPADVSPAAQKAYQQALRRYQQYQDTRAMAESMRIPVLNTNRFLMLTGYDPAGD